MTGVKLHAYSLATASLLGLYWPKVFIRLWLVHKLGMILLIVQPETRMEIRGSKFLYIFNGKFKIKLCWLCILKRLLNILCITIYLNPLLDRPDKRLLNS